MTLNLDEGALYAVEWAAQDADRSAFAEVYLIGTEVDQFLVAVPGDLDELLHVPVGDDDRLVAAFRWLCEPLEEGDVLFNFLNFLLAGVDEDQIVDSGNQFLCPVSVALGHGHVFHGNEAFNPVALMANHCRRTSDAVF